MRFVSAETRLKPARLKGRLTRRTTGLTMAPQ
jgi:hypothetical protein